MHLMKPWVCNKKNVRLLIRLMPLPHFPPLQPTTGTPLLHHCWPMQLFSSFFYFLSCIHDVEFSYTAGVRLAG